MCAPVGCLVSRTCCVHASCSPVPHKPLGGHRAMVSSQARVCYPAGVQNAKRTVKEQDPRSGACACCLPTGRGLRGSKEGGGRPGTHSPVPSAKSGPSAPTLSLECRLQEDITVCFLGLPLGRLPLFRFCTSFSCSLQRVTNRGHRTSRHAEPHGFPQPEHSTQPMAGASWAEPDLLLCRNICTRICFISTGYRQVKESKQT